MASDDGAVRPLDIVIVGAGPTAIGALYRIEQLRTNGLIDKETQVRVIEQEAEAGGLARSVTDAAGFTWDLGVHVTGASKYDEFLLMLQDVVTEWNVIRRVVMADMTDVMFQGGSKSDQLCSSSSTVAGAEPKVGMNYVPYPVQNSIPYFPVELKRDCLRDLERSNGFAVEHKPTAEENFGKFSEKIFGPTFQSIFIRPYNEKVWTVPLEEMNCKWLEGRVPRIDTQNIRRRCTLSRRQLAAEDDAQESYFRYPSNFRGVGEMWKKIVETKFNDEIFRFRRKVRRIDPIAKQITVDVIHSDSSIVSGQSKETRTSEEESYSYDTLISTIPLTELGRITGLAPNIALRFSKVVLVGVGLHLPQSALSSQLSWAYYPRAETIFYRCTALSNFSTALVPDATKYWSVLCEIGMRPEESVDKKLLSKRTVQDLVAVGMIGSESQVNSTWLKVLHHGYPVPTLDRETILRDTHAKLAAHSIYSRGRFGGWRYEISNQDHSFECGLQLVDRLFLGIPESLYEN